ncbi:hypothetical protein BOX15_Mlig011928g3, partial [Macrostomum lignano]
SATMFWQMPSIISNIEPLLDKQGVELSEILEEESVIQECKAQNQKLITYLAQDSILDQLVDAIVTEPSAELPHRQRYRRANVCCELLACDADALTTGLVKENRRLDQLYDFLKGEPPLNPLLSSFFSKVMQLLARKQSDRLLAYLSSKGEEFIDLLIRHMGTSAVMDFLVSVVTMRSVDEYGLQYQQLQQQQSTQVAAWLAQTGLVDKLLATLASDRSPEEQYNGAQCLINIIAYCRDLAAAAQDSSEAANSSSAASSTPSATLLDQLESGDTAGKLLAKMLDGAGGPSESGVAAGAQVLLALLDGRRGANGAGDLGDFSSIASMALAQQQQQPAASETERLAAAALNVIEAVSPRLPKLAALLSAPPPHRLARMPTTAGQLEPPLGQCRLHVARLVRSLLSTNSALAGRAVAECGALPQLLSLMLAYPWNTFLHQAVEQSCTSVLTAQPANQDQTEAQTLLLRQLLVEANLLGRLLDSFAQPTVAGSVRGGADSQEGTADGAKEAGKEQMASSCNSRRLGYLGHLARLANCLNDALAAAATPKTTAATSNGTGSREHLAEAFNQLDESLRERWKAWTESDLAELNRRSVIVASPLSSQEDDSTPYSIDASPLQALHHAYAEFQAKQLTSNFPDHFGFQEDEFNEPYDRVEAIFDDKVSSLDFTTPTPEDADNATMFDQACNSQIQQYDDEDDDDDDNNSAAAAAAAAAMSTTIDDDNVVVGEENGEIDDDNFRVTTPRTPTTASAAGGASAAMATTAVVVPRLIGAADIDNENDEQQLPRTPPRSPVNILGGDSSDEGEGDGDDDDQVLEGDAVDVVEVEDDDDEDDDDEEEEDGIGPAVILSGGARRRAEAEAAAEASEASEAQAETPTAADAATVKLDASADAAESAEGCPEFTNLEQLMLPAEDAAAAAAAGGDQTAS